jgi:hypothetical protein
VVDAADAASKKERDAADAQEREPEDNMTVLELAVWPDGAEKSFPVTHWASFEVAFRMEELAAAFPHAVDGDALDTALIRRGDRCRAKIRHEVYKGRAQAKVDELLPAAAEGGDACPF